MSALKVILCSGFRIVREALPEKVDRPLGWSRGGGERERDYLRLNVKT